MDCFKCFQGRSIEKGEGKDGVEGEAARGVFEKTKSRISLKIDDRDNYILCQNLYQ